MLYYMPDMNDSTKISSLWQQYKSHIILVIPTCENPKK